MSITIATAALPMSCDEESFMPPSPFQSFKICPEFLFLQFAFITVYPLCSYRCITIRFDYLLIYFFPYRTGFDCYRSNNKGSRYVNQINPIGKQLRDNDICLRPVYAKIFKLKLTLGWPFELPKLSFVTVELQLKYFVDTGHSNK